MLLQVSDEGDGYLPLDMLQDLAHSRSADEERSLNGIWLKLHQKGDIGNMLIEPAYIVDTEPMYLVRGMEYHLDVIPIGTKSSERFRRFTVF